MTGILRFIVHEISLYLSTIKVSVKSEDHRNRWSFYDEKEYEKTIDIKNVNVMSRDEVLKHQMKYSFVFFLCIVIAAIFEIKEKEIDFYSWQIWIYVFAILIFPTSKIVRTISWFSSFDSGVLFSWALFVKDDKMEDSLLFLDKTIEAYPNKDLFKTTKVVALLISGKFEECRSYCDLLKKEFTFEMAADNNVIKNAEYILHYLYTAELNYGYLPVVDSYHMNPTNETYEVALLINQSKNPRDKSFLEHSDTIKSFPIDFCKSIVALLLADTYATGEKEKMLYFQDALKYSPSNEMTECINKHILCHKRKLNEFNI